MIKLPMIPFYGPKPPVRWSDFGQTPVKSADMAPPTRPLTTNSPATPTLSSAGRWLSLNDAGAKALHPGDQGKPDAVATRRAEILEVGKQFEAIFMRYLITAMRSGSVGGGEQGGRGAPFYEGLIDENLSRVMAESGNGLGLGEMLSRSMPIKPTEDEG
jgi:hypothetical protein